MGDFCMPSLGADMVQGTLVEWCVEPGDHVKRGDIVAVVETDKGAIDVEIFEDGVVDRLLVEPWAKVPVGTPLARIRGADDDAAPVRSPAPERPAPVALSPEEPAPPPPSVASDGPRSRGNVRASPRARARAAALGVDLATLKGTGPGGSVTADDVVRAASGPQPTAAGPAPATPVARPAKGDATRPDAGAAMRRAIAAAVARSNRDIPHYYLDQDVDMTASEGWLTAWNAERPASDRVLHVALLLKAAALAAREHPHMNGIYDGDGFRPSDRVHLGVAVSLRGGGLVIPAIHDVDKRAVSDVMLALSDLVLRARSGRLRSSELTDATLTVTSLGVAGVTRVFPVIYPPQVAIVGYGRLALRPWVDGERVVPRPLINVSLGADHRVSDGHAGALYLRAIDRLLQTPEKL